PDGVPADHLGIRPAPDGHGLGQGGRPGRAGVVDRPPGAERPHEGVGRGPLGVHRHLHRLRRARPADPRAGAAALPQARPPAKRRRRQRPPDPRASLRARGFIAVALRAQIFGAQRATVIKPQARGLARGAALRTPGSRTCPGGGAQSCFCSGLRFSTRLLLFWSMVTSMSTMLPMMSMVSEPRKTIAMLYLTSRPFSASKISVPRAPSDFRLPLTILNSPKPASPLGGE